MKIKDRRNEQAELKSKNLCPKTDTEKPTTDSSIEKKERNPCGNGDNISHQTK